MDGTTGLPVDPLWPRAGHWLRPAGSLPADAAVDVALLGVPASRTSLSATQAHLTPAAVRAALLRYSTAAPDRDTDLDHLVAVDLGDRPDPDDDEAGTVAAAAEAVARARLLVGVGGDNSVTYALAIGALGADLGRAGLVTVDAHHDLRDGVSNGSPVRRLVEAGIDATRIAQVGIADFANSAAYAARARDLGVTVISRGEVARRGISAAMTQALGIAGSAGGPVYVDLDVDVCDRAIAPACPASVPGGLSAPELREAAFLAGRHPQVVAVDLTEVDAAADTADQRTVRLAALCVLEAAAGLSRREDGA